MQCPNKFRHASECGSIPQSDCDNLYDFRFHAPDGRIIEDLPQQPSSYSKESKLCVTLTSYHTKTLDAEPKNQKILDIGEGQFCTFSSLQWRVRNSLLFNTLGPASLSLAQTLKLCKKEKGFQIFRSVQSAPRHPRGPRHPSTEWIKLPTTCPICTRGPVGLPRWTGCRKRELHVDKEWWCPSPTRRPHGLLCKAVIIYVSVILNVF